MIQQSSNPTIKLIKVQTLLHDISTPFCLSRYCRRYGIETNPYDNGRLGNPATDREILQNAGKVSAEIAKAHDEIEFE